VVISGEMKVRPILERLRKKLSGAKAVLFLGPSGIVDHIKIDPGLDLDTLAGEHAMLLRIATRTSEDTGGGNLTEHIVISDRFIVMARHISGDHFLVVVFRSKDHIGRTRYELKNAAWELDRAVNERGLKPATT